MNNKTHVNIVQILTDLACLALTYVLSILLTDAIFHYVDFSEYLWIPVQFGMAYIFTMFTSEMYHRSTFTYQDRTLKYVMKACIFGAVFCFVMIPFTSKDIFAINILLVYILVAIIIISMQYLIVQELRQAISSRWKKRAILIGMKENMQEYLYFIKKTSFQVDVAGCITLDGFDNMNEKDLGSINDLDRILAGNIVDEVIFTVPCSLMEEVRPYVLTCKERGITVRLAVDFFENDEHSSSVHSVGTIPVFTYQSSTLNDAQTLFKRTIDVFGAIIGLIITAVLSVFIIPLVRFQAGEPIITRGKYLSLNGRQFNLYRFKTDPAKSRFLIKSGFCNLPIFWNVLKGDMSLVGSLPARSVNIDGLSNKQKNITLKPGLTGLWRFTDHNRMKDENHLAELNNKYLHKWSFIRDIWLIIKTVAIILTTKAGSIGTSLFDCLDESNNATTCQSE